MARMRWHPTAMLFLVLHLGGCVTWTPARQAPRAVIESEAHRRVRVHYEDGLQRVLANPTILGDSIVESGQVCSNGVCERRTATSPLDGIARLEVQTVDEGRTALLVAALGFVAIGVVAALTYRPPEGRFCIPLPACNGYGSSCTC